MSPNPNPYGSGKKYKHCCRKEDEADEHEALVAAAAAKPSRPIAPKTLVYPDFDDEEEDELTSASNAVVDLVRAGKLEEAEQGARDLLVRFPDVHDGYDRERRYSGDPRWHMTKKPPCRTAINCATPTSTLSIS